MNILVTGSSGYIGSYVMAEIEKRGHKAMPYDLPYSILNYKDLLLQASDAHAIIHLAAMSDMVSCERYPADAWYVNLQGTRTVAMVAHVAKIPVVFASSAAVYHSLCAKLPNVVIAKGKLYECAADEFGPLLPSTYGASKYLAEKALRSICKLNHASLRFFNVIGGNDSNLNRLVPAWLMSSRNCRQWGRPIMKVQGNQCSTRSYIDVRTVAEVATAFAIEMAHGAFPLHPTTNVANPLNWLALGEMICRLRNVATVPEHCLQYDNAFRAGEAVHLRADCDRLQRQLREWNYAPEDMLSKYSISETLEHAVKETNER